MKKFSKNASFGKLAILFNVLILGMFIVSMICLMSFDKVNTKLLHAIPAYKDAETELREVEKPRRQAQADVNYYAVKLDTLQHRTLPADKKKAKEHNEEIERTIHTLAIKEAELEKVDAAIQEQTIFFEAIRVPFEDLTGQVNSAKSVFSITLWIIVIMFVLKVLFFGAWNYRSLKNLRIASPWMKKSTSPYWAYLGWFIPGYNLIKPYTIFAEVYNETNDLLVDKKIIQKDIDENADFNLGLWWGLLIITTIIVSFVLSATFFKESPMYYKFSHTGVVVTAIVFWLLYLLQESVLILRGIKMNRILLENHPKFDLQ
jgi:hypothetical protein